MLLGAALGFAIGAATVDMPFMGMLIGLGVGALVGLGVRKDPTKR
jgi:hypothetical protein